MKIIGFILFFVSAFAFGECGYTQREMNECAERGRKLADEELNRLYKVQMSYLKSDVKIKQLRDTQRAWIKYRDAVCAYEVTSEGGSMHPMETSLCLANKTRMRNKELSNYVNCRENGCPD